MSDRLSLDELSRRFRNLSAMQNALKDVATEVVAIGVQDTQDRMAKGLQPSGEPQPPIKNPRPSGNTGPRLIDWGSLRKSVSAVVDGRFLVMRARGPGARKHQAETPFLGLSSSARRRITTVLLRRLLEKAATGES